MSRNHWLRTLLMRYASALFATVAQSAACNRAHGIEERMCRWLLMIHDRADGDTFPGEDCHLAAAIPNKAGTLQCRGGQADGRPPDTQHVHEELLRERAKLETTSCECYARVKR
jgi:hypothetical protein